MSDAITVAFPDYINQRFKRALGLVRNLPKKSLFQPSNADKLKLYGLYKQASFGDINTPQPDRWDLLDRAKWEAWRQFKGMDATSAKQQYVDTLIGCVIQFLTQLPENTDAKQLAQSLQHFDAHNSDNNDDFQSLSDDDERDLFYTEHLQPEFLEQYFRGTNSSSASSKLSHHPDHDKQSSRHNSITPKVHDYHPQSTNMLSHHTKQSSITPEYPLTPAMSPEYQPRIRYGNHYDVPGVHRLIATDSFLNFNSSEDNQSDADTIDREVAATTAKIGVSAPRRAYTAPASGNSTKSKQIIPKNTIEEDGESETEVPSRKPSSSDRSKPRSEQSSRLKSVDNNTRLSSVAERALENLQTDVTALTEQIDILRRGIFEKEMKRKAEKWTWSWLFKTTAKHAVVNLIILTLIFLFLLKRKSPIAYAIIAYLGPWWNDIWFNFIRKFRFSRLLKRY
ncbi:acyl CoA binding protein-domain-containing protein [Umbelopsis sp. PMI_123]|nr:acyl CoA binding protein-domain-containing protein [Umbelopsis sp. PMI_123]